MHDHRAIAIRLQRPASRRNRPGQLMRLGRAYLHRLPGGAGGGGAEVVRRSASLLGEVRFLALSVSDSAEDVVGVIRAGARGYITKASSGADVADAIRTVGS